MHSEPWALQNVMEFCRTHNWLSFYPVSAGRWYHVIESNRQDQWLLYRNDLKQRIGDGVEKKKGVKCKIKRRRNYMEEMAEQEKR